MKLRQLLPEVKLISIYTLNNKGKELLKMYNMLNNLIDRIWKESYLPYLKKV